VEPPKIAPYFAVLLVTAAGTLALAFKTDVRFTGEAGVRDALPARVGEWSGEEILYCQNPACDKLIKGSEIGEDLLCPRCGGRTSSGSLTEWALLPADTGIHKMLYTHDSTGENLMVSLVLSGASRTSIHRPQICLVGNGREITSTRIIRVDLEDGEKLGVTLLDMLWRGQGSEGRPAAQRTFFAYWFIGKGHETPRHLARMFWMAFDRIVHGLSHRWAYVGVSGERLDGSREHERRARSFIRELEPLIEKT
jgi:hypothetical protein